MTNRRKMTMTTNTEKPAALPGQVQSVVGPKARVSEILHEALRGYDLSKRYRTEGGFVRWGLVEKDIHAAIDESNAAISGDSPAGGATEKQNETAYSGFFIVNDFDRPDEELIAGKGPDGKFYYVHPRLRDVKEYHGMNPAGPTALEDFGIQWTTNNGKFMGMLIDESRATYRDGLPRKWQGSVRFSFSIQNAVETTTKTIRCPECGKQFCQTVCTCGYEHSCGGPLEACGIPGCNECGCDKCGNNERSRYEKKQLG